MGEAVQPAPAARRVHYERRRPEDTVLYQLVQEHLENFLAQVELETGAGLPEFVEEEFDAFLDCGILARGFLRLRCADCAHEKLVAFSCNVARLLSGLWRPAHGGDGRPPGRSRHPPGAGAPMGVGVSDPAALAVCRTSPSAVLGVADRPPCPIDLPDPTNGARTHRGQDRRCHAHPAFRITRQFEHPSALPRARWVYHTSEGLPVFYAVRAPTAEELQSLLARIIKRLMNRMHRDVQL